MGGCKNKEETVDQEEVKWGPIPMEFVNIKSEPGVGLIWFFRYKIRTRN